MYGHGATANSTECLFTVHMAWLCTGLSTQQGCSEFCQFQMFGCTSF
jgi:hypothetical protein